MLGVAVIRGVPLPLTRREILILVALGVTNQAAYLGFSYVGLQNVSSGVAAIIISANPVLTSVLAVLFLGEVMTHRKAVGLILGVAGVVFVVGHRLEGGIDHPVGIALTIAALISMVSGTVLFKKIAPEGGLWTSTGVQNLSSGVAVLPFALGFESIGDITVSWRLIFAIGYLALFVSVLAYLLWFHLLTVFGATAASSYHFLMPPLGLVFGWLLLDEQIRIGDLMGILPVAVGVYLVTHSEPSRRVRHDRNACPLTQ